MNCFGESNRLAIINWQKTSGPKNDKNHVASTTEYVLVYGKDAEKAKTEALRRDGQLHSLQESRQRPQRELGGGHDLMARTPVQGPVPHPIPFTGLIRFPQVSAAGRNPSEKMKSGSKRGVSRTKPRHRGRTRTSARDQRCEGADLNAKEERPAVGPARSQQRPKASKSVLMRDNWPFFWLGLTGPGDGG